MNKIRIIDLLNKIANGEEVPKKFKYEDLIITRDEVDNYIDNDGDMFTDSILTDFSNLNDEIEIIEGKKIPERIPNAEVFEVPKLNSMELSNIALTNKEDIRIIKDTLNKVLDYLKSKGE